MDDLEAILETKYDELEEIRKPNEMKEEINDDVLAKLELNKTNEPNLFEVEVFSYLFKNRKKYKISKVYKFHNSLIDGYIELANGNIILFEIKYVLGWHKVCTARIQFKRFFCLELFNSPKIKLNPKKISGGFIFFNNMNEKNGKDWGAKAKDRMYLNGWYRFYEEQNRFENKDKKEFKIRILNLNKKKLSNEPY